MCKECMNGIFFLSYTILDNSRDDLVRYNLAILSPVLLVLVGASGVIPPRTIKQEQRVVGGPRFEAHAGREVLQGDGLGRQ